jgi:hypothetical protein
MTTTLGEFTDTIRADIRRGSALDALIPGFIRKGALWIERNNTLQYMRKFAEIRIDIEADEQPRYISLINTRIKAVESFHWDFVEGRRLYLAQRQPQDFPVDDTGVPAGYWLDGVDRIVLSATPNENLYGQMILVKYSDWPTSPSATHWLIDNAEDVLEAQAMIAFAKHARDEGAMAFWKGVFDAALPGLYAADAEMTWSNTDLAMEYYGTNS